MNTKTITASNGSSVNTAWWEVENQDGPVALEVSVQTGATQVNKRITVGAADKPVDNLTQESMQAQLDAARQELADIAASRDASKNLLPNLK